MLCDDTIYFDKAWDFQKKKPSPRDSIEQKMVL